MSECEELNTLKEKLDEDRYGNIKSVYEIKE